MPNKTEENYRKYILPLLGVAETITTKGGSPGATALQQEQLFRQRDVDEAERLKQALEQKYRQSQTERQAGIDVEEGKSRALQQRLSQGQIAKAEREGIKEAARSNLPPPGWGRAGGGVNCRV